MTIQNLNFVIAIRKFVEGNLDKVQALWGILDTGRYGIDRKVKAIADILGIDAQDVPQVANRHCGTHGIGTQRAIASHLATAIRRDWRKFTSDAEWIRVRRNQLRERAALDWLNLPFAERIQLKGESRAANGTIITCRAAPPINFVWSELQVAKKELAKIAS